MTESAPGAGVSSGRRRFMACAAGAVAVAPCAQAKAEPPSEIDRIRLMNYPAICGAPVYIAEEMLKAEGFKHIELIKSDIQNASFVGPDKADFDIDAIGPILKFIDKGEPLVALSGMHIGCYELFGSKHVRGVRDLKGKTVPVNGIGGAKHVFLSSMAAYVGIDPRKDINWVSGSTQECKDMYLQGKAHAFLGFAPEPQELRARKVGPVIVNTATDKPWSNYLCCMLISYREFVEKHPIATKRAIRAIFKAADLCASDPGRAARFMVERGFTENLENALASLKELRFNAWRSFNPEDSLRFYANRLHEVGMIKNSPQKLMAQGGDWRFLNELRKELKA